MGLLDGLYERLQKDRLVQLEKELDEYEERLLPRWAYSSDEWNRIVFERKRLRDKVKGMVKQWKGIM